jgi:hypothetical protein
MEKATLAKEKKDEGWSAKGKVGLTGALSSNRQFVGAEDGTTVQLGTVLGDRLVREVLGRSRSDLTSRSR